MSEWVSTAKAAAALGVSERTVLRRAAAGKLESRKETTSRGVAVIVALDTDKVPTGADRGADIQSTLKTPQNGLQVRTGGDGGATGADARLLAHLSEENRFLRSTIEQLQRDGAETRAALREALKMAPKALTTGGAAATVETGRSMQETRPKARGPGEREKTSPLSQNEPETVTYDKIADWIENQMEGDTAMP